MKRKFNPKFDLPMLIIVAGLGVLAVYLAWNSGPVAAIWPAAN